MRVTMTMPMQGPEISLNKGAEYEFGNEQAIRLIDAAFAYAKDPEEEAAVRQALADAVADPVDPDAAAKAEADAAAVAAAAETEVAAAAAPAKPAAKKKG